MNVTSVPLLLAITCAHVHIQVYLGACVFVRVCTHIDIHAYAHMHVYTCASICVHTCTYVCVCRVCVYNPTVFSPTAWHLDRLATPNRWVFTVSSKLEVSSLAGVRGVPEAEAAFGPSQAHTRTSGEQGAVSESLSPAVLGPDAQEDGLRG